MHPVEEFLSGTCRQFLYSPKGHVEGLMLSVQRKRVQVVVDPAEGQSLALGVATGSPVHLIATLDTSPKAADARHPVYRFKTLADPSGQAIKASPRKHKDASLEGVVASLHFARHGQVNGVVLKTGEFIHTRPHGFEVLDLNVGSRVRAQGELRQTVLGTSMLEARQVNGTTLG